MILRTILAATLVLFAQALFSQKTLSVDLSNPNGEPLIGIEVYVDGVLSGKTDESGKLVVELDAQPNIVAIINEEFYPQVFQVSDMTFPIELGKVKMIRRLAGQTETQIEEGLSDEDELDEDISSLLAGSSDLFTSSAAFNWGPLRFAIRGYQSSGTHVLINGFEVNDPENGRVNWNVLAGLNDVTRNNYGGISLNTFDFDFGNLGGAVVTDMRAMNQRKQLRASISQANRSYRNRAMLTYSSGRMKGGWYVSASGSRRWAQEGYIEGTFYDAWAYYLGVSKEFNDKHSLHLMGFGAPVHRGRSSPGIQLSYDIAGSNYYNSYWGYQNGEKRNSRVVKQFSPTFLLEYNFKPSENLKVDATVGYQRGTYGSSALNWTFASDPRPDYYQKLPNYFADQPDVYQAVYDALANDESRRQVQWDELYNRNRQNLTTIENVNGIEGNDVTGILSQYNVEERHFDPSSLQGNIRTQWALNDRFKLEGGVRYLSNEKDNYVQIADLLGSDFVLDVNRFENDEVLQQTDLENPNRLVGEGDRYRYSYQMHSNEVDFWIQPRWTSAHWDLSGAVKLGRTNYQRNGDFRTGPFPNNSLGDSETVSFDEWGAKFNATYKISGRHYLYANAYFAEEAPFMTNSMVSPRTRNDFRNDLTTEKRMSFEGAYVLRSPSWKGKILGYYTEINDRMRHQTAFIDNDLGFGEFGNILTSNIDQQHMGIEAVLEVKLGAGFEAGFAAAVGQYIYTDRFDFTLVSDLSDIPLLEDQTIYSKNFYIPGTPQQAYALELKYNSSNYWFASITGNYLTERYLDFYPLRRTELAVQGIDREINEEAFQATIQQELVDPAFTVNLFGGKSWRIDDKYIYLTIGVNNVLNDQNIITGGFEQFRFAISDNVPDLDRFPNKYYYAYGLNYFVNLSLRL